jgi:hypothetical protein
VPGIFGTAFAFPFQAVVGLKTFASVGFVMAVETVGCFNEGFNIDFEGIFLSSFLSLLGAPTFLFFAGSSS